MIFSLLVVNLLLLTCPLVGHGIGLAQLRDGLPDGSRRMAVEFGSSAQDESDTLALESRFSEVLEDLARNAGSDHAQDINTAALHWLCGYMEGRLQLKPSAWWKKSLATALELGKELGQVLVIDQGGPDTDKIQFEQFGSIAITKGYGLLKNETGVHLEVKSVERFVMLPLDRIQEHEGADARRHICQELSVAEDGCGGWVLLFVNIGFSELTIARIAGDGQLVWVKTGVRAEPNGLVGSRTSTTAVEVKVSESCACVLGAKNGAVFFEAFDTRTGTPIEKFDSLRTRNIRIKR
jgi:hypothetical protein